MPASSGEIPTLDLDRSQEVDRRHRQIAELLKSRKMDALVLQKPANFAWLSCGGQLLRPGSNEAAAALFLTRESRVAICSNVDSQYLFDRELHGLGFQLKERQWPEGYESLVRDLCRGRIVASDTGVYSTINIDPSLCGLRITHSRRDMVGLRRLGRSISHAVEATGRSLEQGATEAEVAAQLAHRLIKHEITPVRISVQADGQGRRYRHWAFGSDRIERYCVLSIVGRKHGLHVGTSRTVSFGPPPDDLLQAHQVAALIHASGQYFSQPGLSMSDTFRRVARLYEKFGMAEEWRHAEQAETIGYDATGLAVTGQETRLWTETTAAYWHPSVRGAALGDTILVDRDGFELLTPMEKWPSLTIDVKGTPVAVPGILNRGASSDWAIA